jgi:hypothetical protein
MNLSMLADADLELVSGGDAASDLQKMMDESRKRMAEGEKKYFNNNFPIEGKKTSDPVTDAFKKATHGGRPPKVLLEKMAS